MNQVMGRHWLGTCRTCRWPVPQNTREFHQSHSPRGRGSLLVTLEALGQDGTRGPLGCAGCPPRAG